MAAVHHNVAYDLDRFARKPAIKEKEITVIRTGRKARLEKERKYLAVIGVTLSMMVLLWWLLHFYTAKCRLQS